VNQKQHEFEFDYRGKGRLKIDYCMCGAPRFDPIHNVKLADLANAGLESYKIATAKEPLVDAFVPVAEPQVTRPYPRSGPASIICRGDGKIMSVGFNIDPLESSPDTDKEHPVAYGTTLADALRELAKLLDAEVGYVDTEPQPSSYREQALREAKISLGLKGSFPDTNAIVSLIADQREQVLTQAQRIAELEATLKVGAERLRMAKWVIDADDAIAILAKKGS
jgi:hypothetical protein